MYENKIFKRDACDEVTKLLHPRHRFAKTRTRRGEKRGNKETDTIHINSNLKK